MIYSQGKPNYESFYHSSMSSFDSDYGNFVGYKIPGGRLGQSMNPTTANQLQETMNTLKTGTKEIEVQMLGIQDVDQQIPKQHFKEIRGLLKLSGATASLHGPVLDSAGFGNQGRAEETIREENKRRFFDAVEKAYELDPKGNTVVVFHASNGMPGPVYKVDETKKPGEEGRMIIQQNYAIDQETGSAVPLKLEKEFEAGAPETFDKGGIDFTPEQQLRMINTSEWRKALTNLAEYNKHANEVIGNSALFLGEFQNAYLNRETNEVIDKKTGEKLSLTPEQINYYNNLHRADAFLENVELGFNTAFRKAYKYGTEEQRQALKQLAEDYKQNSERFYEKEVPFLQPIEKQKMLTDYIEMLNRITYRQAPQQFLDAQKYALEKSSDTFVDVALRAYDKFGKNAPVLAIENYAPGTAFNRAEDLRKLIEKTREEFVERLREEKGLSKSEAKRVAESQIGATWDVGHVNFHRKYGFTEEEIVAETEKIAPVVKHLHLTDNFGYSDSHLVPGMGNVPFKKHLEKLEKAGILDKVRKVVEAGGYIQQISKMGVHGETMSAFSSPIYGMKMAPYWNQTLGFRGNYFGGYGTINPQVHHSVYGSGFTTLPTELGGNIPGGGSRFSGNPTA